VVGPFSIISEQRPFTQASTHHSHANLKIMRSQFCVGESSWCPSQISINGDQLSIRKIDMGHRLNLHPSAGNDRASSKLLIFQDQSEV
jgi:hypothetical protein